MTGSYCLQSLISFGASVGNLLDGDAELPLRFETDSVFHWVPEHDRASAPPIPDTTGTDWEQVSAKTSAQSHISQLLVKLDALHGGVCPIHG